MTQINPASMTPAARSGACPAPARRREPPVRHGARAWPWAVRLALLTLPCLLGLAGLAASGPARAQPQPPEAASQEGQPQQLPMVDLTAGLYRIRAMVAQTPQQREIGLMWRREMAANEGMLFVFEEPRPQCFWMKNTLIPLSIAFVADDGTIVNLDEMKPRTLTPHCSTAPVRYVLEMNAGWFKAKGLRSGDRLGGAMFRGSR